MKREGGEERKKREGIGPPTFSNLRSALYICTYICNSPSVVWDFFWFEAVKNGCAIDNGKPRCRARARFKLYIARRLHANQ
jgi:hypothetical protein